MVENRCDDGFATHACGIPERAKRQQKLSLLMQHGRDTAASKIMVCGCHVSFEGEFDLQLIRNARADN